MASSAGAGSGSRPASFARIRSQCAGMMLKRTLRGHDRPEHGADLEVGGSTGEDLSGAVRRAHDQRQQQKADDGVALEGHASEVVDHPCRRQPDQADRDRRRYRDVRDGLVDQIRVGIRVVENDQQCKAGEPCRVGLPLEPVQRLGQLVRCDPVLRDPVEAAAVDLPRLAGHALLRHSWPAEVVVECDEVERGADPDDPGDDVQPAKTELEPVLPVGVDQRRCQRSCAIATSSLMPVSSSSSRVRASRSRMTSSSSPRGRPATKTTKRKPNFSS